MLRKQCDRLWEAMEPPPSRKALAEEARELKAALARERKAKGVRDRQADLLSQRQADVQRQGQAELERREEQLERREREQEQERSAARRLQSLLAESSALKLVLERERMDKLTVEREDAKEFEGLLHETRLLQATVAEQGGQLETQAERAAHRMEALRRQAAQEIEGLLAERGQLQAECDREKSERRLVEERAASRAVDLAEQAERAGQAAARARIEAEQERAARLGQQDTAGRLAERFEALSHDKEQLEAQASRLREELAVQAAEKAEIQFREEKAEALLTSQLPGLKERCLGLHAQNTALKRQLEVAEQAAEQAAEQLLGVRQQRRAEQLDLEQERSHDKEELARVKGKLAALEAELQKTMLERAAKHDALRGDNEPPDPAELGGRLSVRAGAAGGPGGQDRDRVGRAAGRPAGRTRGSQAVDGAQGSPGRRLRAGAGR